MPLYSPEERRQFSRIGIDPQTFMAQRDAAGALSLGGLARNVGYQNWRQALQHMSLPS
jgi:hypothetical protein